MFGRARRFLIAATAALAFSAFQSAAASPDAVAKDEIDHLLKFVASSSCTFVRNGTEYPAGQARDHLASKYDVAGGRIASADDFIKYLASQSSITGEPYRVKCASGDAPANAWLSGELDRYRKASRTRAAQ